MPYSALQLVGFPKLKILIYVCAYRWCGINIFPFLSKPWLTFLFSRRAAGGSDGLHKTAILNRDENINDPSSAADFYVDPAPVKSRRRLILGGLCSLLLLLPSSVATHTEVIQADKIWFVIDIWSATFSCSNFIYQYLICGYCNCNRLIILYIVTMYIKY